MTRQELKRIESQCENVKKGYCCFSNEDPEIKKRCIELGSNSGVYGWNWTAYLDTATDTLYIDGYRNF